VFSKHSSILYKFTQCSHVLEVSLGTFQPNTEPNRTETEPNSRFFDFSVRCRFPILRSSVFGFGFGFSTKPSRTSEEPKLNQEWKSSRRPHSTQPFGVSAQSSGPRGHDRCAQLSPTLISHPLDPSPRPRPSTPQTARHDGTTPSETLAAATPSPPIHSSHPPAKSRDWATPSDPLLTPLCSHPLANTRDWRRLGDSVGSPRRRAPRPRGSRRWRGGGRDSGGPEDLLAGDWATPESSISGCKNRAVLQCKLYCSSF